MARLNAGGQIEIYNVQSDQYEVLTLVMVEALEATAQNFGLLVQMVDDFRQNNLAEVQAILRGNKADGEIE